MNIVSYNILNPFHALLYRTEEGYEAGKKGEIKDNWHRRCYDIIDNLNKSDFSVACLQEVSTKTLSDLSRKYFVVGASFHQSDSDEAQHGVAILFNPNKVDLLKVREFYSLEERENYRGELYADFYDRATERTVRVASCHLKSYDPTEKSVRLKQHAKEPGYQQLVDLLGKVEADSEDIDAIVIAGDLNEDMSEYDRPLSRQKCLQQHDYDWDGSTNATENGTGRKIDWIFFKGKNGAQFDCSPLDLSSQNQRVSDHRMVGTRVVPR